MPTRASAPLVVSLDELEPTALAQGGGKALNLGILRQAGLPVPPGFCLTTRAYALIAAAADLAPLVERLSAATDEEVPACAAALRARLEAAPLPAAVQDALATVVAALGETTPLAVRSSATAEDLPFASFAGQQDTLLDVVGTANVAAAVRACWASLWTTRAVLYRRQQDLDPRGVQLAVVIQQLVDATAAGVLFTANPLTGRRGQAVVEATAGLGDALVSGAVNPDHWTLDLATGARLDGPAAGSLTPPQLAALAALGRQVETVFGTPQDVEFALDRAGTIWLVQARAITTLYPLPAPPARPPDAAAVTDDLRVYFSFNVAQGVLRPLTPLGIDALGRFTIAVAAAIGVPRTTSVLITAGDRLFLDLTTPLRSPFWRPVVRAALGQAEARSAAALAQVLDDPRLAVRAVGLRATVWPVVRALWRTRLPLQVGRALAAPAEVHRQLAALRADIEAAGEIAAGASARERLAAAEALLATWPPRMLPELVPVLLAGLGSLNLGLWLVGSLADADLRDRVRRALPHNPTTEMDLQLWALAEALRDDPTVRAALRDRPAAELADAFRDGTLPPRLQRELTTFLASYGHRAVAEIDLGLPRWADDPTALLATLAAYELLDAGPRSPAGQFAAAAAAATDAVAELTARVAARDGPRQARLVHWLLTRGRELAGYRELPKYLVVVVLDRARTQLRAIGAELVAAGRLEAGDDVFFLSFDEVARALDGADFRAAVAARQATYAQELRRRHVPRVLLSDGTEPTPPADASAGPGLRGTAASAGQVTGPARLVREPTAAHLQPGDILVAPSTDPGWTPLFLSAAGLVMEMGGAMSHGAVVAREYGIPAVVGVAGALEQLTDGQRITVDGSAGTVTWTVTDPELAP